MRVYFVRGIDIHDGKARPAWEWAIKITDYANETFPEANFEVLQQIGGGVNRVFWMNQFDSMAALEAWIDRSEADEGFQQLVAESTVPGVRHPRGRSRRRLVGEPVCERHFRRQGVRIPPRWHAVPDDRQLNERAVAGVREPLRSCRRRIRQQHLCGRLGHRHRLRIPT